MLNLNIIVHQNPKEAILASLEKKEKVFIESSHYLINFLIIKLHRYLVMPIPKKLYNFTEKMENKNININDFNLYSPFKEHIIKTPFNILIRNLYKQTENMLDFLKNSSQKTIHTTKEGNLLITWYIKEKNIPIENIRLYSPYQIEIIDRGIKDYVEDMYYRRFYPLGLERLLKLYGLLYLSKEKKNENKIKFLADMQEHILSIKHPKDFNPLILEKAFEFFEKESLYFEKVLQMPLNNLVNKIIEELKKLKFLSNLKEIEIDYAYNLKYFVPIRNQRTKFEKDIKNILIGKYNKNSLENKNILSPF